MIKTITKKEVKWLSAYAIDPIGDIFEYEGRILRLIKPEKTSYVMTLFEQGIIKAIVDANLFINTWICNDLVMADAEGTILVEHERISYFTKPCEWTYQMFIDARRVIARLNMCLLQHGYEIIDCHYQNITFYGCHPNYTDLGSIVLARDTNTEGYRTFEKYWINPIKIMERKKFDDTYLKEFIIQTGISTDDKWCLTNNFGRIISKTYKSFSLIQYRLWDDSVKSSRKFVQVVARECQRLFRINNKKKINWKISKYTKLLNRRDKSHYTHKTMWSDYSDVFFQQGYLEPDERFQYYMEQINDLIEKYDAKSIFEVAGNSGVMSQLIIEHTKLKQACVSDYDITAIEKGYQRCKTQDHLNRKISFTVMNIIHTTESDAIRYRSDIVMALAVSHHLILTQKVKMFYFVDILAAYTNKYAIVEFMPLGLWVNDDNCPSIPEWYTLENFLDEMSRKFDIMKVDQIGKNRIAISAEKKDVENL